jgi:hypothetical protein
MGPTTIKHKVLKLRSLSVSILLLLTLAGCGRKNESGLASAFLTDILLSTTAKSFGIAISNEVTPLDDKPSERIGALEELTLIVPIGAQGQFLNSYKNGIQSLLLRSGETIVSYERPVTSFDADADEFRYNYSWLKNTGIVRVMWAKISRNKLKMVVSCGETIK